MKTLLLDIDYTLFDGTTPRPYLKEFLEEVHTKYDIHFYTAADRKRVTEVLRILFHQMSLDRELIRKLERGALTRENCPMIKVQKKGSEIEIKCLQKASEKLNIPLENIIMLDDNPSYDNPHVNQIIQAEGFMEYMLEDDYLKRILLDKL